jgi:hypothetical protein
MRPAVAIGVALATLAAGGTALALALRKREEPTAPTAPTAPPAPTAPTAQGVEANQTAVLQTCLQAISSLDPTAIALAGNGVVSTAPETALLMGEIALQVQEVQQSANDYERNEQAKEKLGETVGRLRDLAANKLTGEPQRLTVAIADQLDTLANPQ